MSSDHLKRLHEEQRLKHAIEYVSEAARGNKHLTTSELARINRIIIAGDDTNWRTSPAVITISSGKTHRFSLISNPIEDARRILGDAFDIANNQDVRGAAIFAYFQLVEEHLFVEANRRTAALAAQWILNQWEYSVDVMSLLDIPLDDVREATVRQSLSVRIMGLIKKE